jgi:hypothetical protein
MAEYRRLAVALACRGD